MGDTRQNANPFQNLEHTVSDEQLQTWQQMNEEIRSLVQMSGDEDDDSLEGVIDDSLLVTNVTAESLGYAAPVRNEPVPGPSTSMLGQAPVGSTIIPNLPASMELTLQYLSGKISLLEFSELMEQENNTTVVEDIAETTVIDIFVEDQEEELESEPKAKPSEPEMKRKRRKKRKRKWDLPPLLEYTMGEVNMIFAQGNHKEAIEQCLEIVRQAPNASKPFQTLAMIYEDMGDVQKSLQYALIAGYLAPHDCEEWARLAEMCLEQNDVGQAIKCYTQAINVNGENKKHCLWERSRLYETIKEYKRALDGYQALLPLLSSVDTEKYFKLAWGITRTFYEQGEKQKAINTMTKAFQEHPDQITSEDVNLFLELLIPEKKFVECLKVFVQHCGVIFTFLGGKQWSDRRCIDVDYLQEYTAISCAVPDILPIDLRVKLAQCLIHLQYIKLVQKVVEPLFEEDIEVNGDLYLDVAEAYMDNAYHKHAEPLLRQLVGSQNYHLAAVWLRYGECLKILGDIQAAVDAYSRVVSLAPSHIGARMSLSALQQQIGKHEEAVECLEHSVEQRKLTKEEGQMLLQKCHLLNAQGKIDEFFEAAKELMFQEWREVEAGNMSYLQAIGTFKHRKESLKMHLQHKGKDTRFVSELTHRKSSLAISFDDMWDMFVSLCNVLIEKKMHVEFEEITLLGMLCPFFSQDERLIGDFEWLVLAGAIISENSIRAYNFGRQMVLEKGQSVHVWNMFLQVIMVGNDNRHNRFCLRKMMVEPNNIMLGIMNGHNSMASGSYKHSIGEYASVFRRTPTDPMLSLCIGLDFIHIASQRFAGKRHYLITQGIVFLHNYLELRGECQESYYNLGRALHQINVCYAAIHYYQKALSYPPCIGEKGGMFDLSREIAYNMSLIYLQSGAKDYARYLLYKYCVI